MEDMNMELLLRYCKRLYTAEEAEKVKALLGNTVCSSRYLADLNLVLELDQDIKEIESIDITKEYQKIWRTIRQRRIVRVKKQLMKYAAFLTLPLLFSSVMLSYLHFIGFKKIETGYVEVVASAGTVVRYELPDKSVVWLNAGSKLSYPANFSSEKREVGLEGEAFFEVESDKKHPFYVNTPRGIQVYVYGTTFNVSAYNEDEYIETVLESGSINVIAPGIKEIIELKPGERFLYELKDSQFVKSVVDVYEKVAWKDGKLIFRNATLEEVLKKLSRHFDVDIQLNNHSSKEYKYRATFRDETLLQILNYLGQSEIMKWRVEEPVLYQDGTFTKKKIIVDLYG